MNMIEKKLESELIYKGHVVTLEKDKVECPNGMKSYREIIRHNGGAAILCITKNNEVMLIKQFRYAYNEVLYEIPAGKLEKGEEPLTAAIREFEEETGNKAKNIEYLGVIYPSCGYTDEKIFLYYVDEMEPSVTHFDEDEVIEVELVPFQKVLEMIMDGTIKDAKTICAIQSYYMKHLNKN